MRSKTGAKHDAIGPGFYYETTPGSYDIYYTIYPQIKDTALAVYKLQWLEQSISNYPQYRLYMKYLFFVDTPIYKI